MPSGNINFTITADVKRFIQAFEKARGELKKFSQFTKHLKDIEIAIAQLETKGQKGLPTVAAALNKLEEVASLTSQALSRIREGKGPQLLELETYRFREHCGPNYDISLGYRTQEELDRWLEKCPIEQLKLHLMKQGMLTHDTLNQMEVEISSEIAKAFEFAKQRH